MVMFETYQHNCVKTRVEVSCFITALLFSELADCLFKMDSICAGDHNVKGFTEYKLECK